MAVDLGIVKKSGAWFTYEGEQLGQGRENAKNYLMENTEVMVEVAEKVRIAAGLGDKDAAEFTAADEAPIDLD
jgi:recombination protein RecA